MTGHNLRRDALQVLALAVEDGDAADAAHALTAALRVHGLDLETSTPNDNGPATVRWCADAMPDAAIVWLCSYQVKYGRPTQTDADESHALDPAEACAVAWRLCNEETCASHDEIADAVAWAEAGGRATLEMVTSYNPDRRSTT